MLTSIVSSYILATLLFLGAVYWLDFKLRLSRQVFFMSLVAFGVTSLGILLVGENSLWSWLLLVSICWHAINCYSGWRQYYAPHQLQQKLWRSWSVLALLNLAFYLGMLFEVSLPEQWFLAISLGGVIVVLSHISWVLRQSRPVRHRQPVSELPTVSMLIPARNEDHALTESLHSALSIDYPKLEILVYDDCSHDKTPQIVRDFAHDGIRFVAGKSLPDDWLGKNYAMHSLAEAATGELLLFCDVDVRLKPNSLNQMVNHFSAEKLEMLSVAPQRVERDLAANIFSPLLSFWQLALPLNFLNIRPVAPNCYLIAKSSYTRIGGHSSFKTSVLPEYYLAHLLKKSYQFALSDKRLGVSTRKKLSSQQDSQTRLMYPLLGANPALVLAALLVASTLFVAPISLLVFNYSPLALWTVLLGFASFAIYNRRTQPNSWLLSSLLAIPAVVIHEMSLLIYSMLKYELATVVWKERNICYPKLQAISHLPSLRD